MGHAGKGRLCCVHNNEITRISANTVLDRDCVYSLQSNFVNKSIKLNKMKLAILAGCHTYGTDSTYGNLPSKLRNLEVDCIISFENSIYVNYAGYFVNRIAKYLDDGKTVSAAITGAKADTKSYYNNAANAIKTVDCVKISGTSSIKIEPAAYGS